MVCLLRPLSPCTVRRRSGSRPSPPRVKETDTYFLTPFDRVGCAVKTPAVIEPQINMNPLRSPPRSDMHFGRSGSQPNLLNPYSDLSSSTFRGKRKHPGEDEVKTQLSDIQKQMADMMTLLTSSINTQAESATKITNDIATIKDQMLDIKTGMGLTEQKIASVAEEQKEIKAEMQTLASTTHAVNGKIEILESDMQKLKTSSHESSVPYEEILAELNEQNLRKKNIIMTGIEEPHSTNPKERHDYVTMEVLKHLNQILENCSEPIKIIRVGKYKQNVNRPVKVFFESEETVKFILRNKTKVSNDAIKMFADQTPYQQIQYKNLKDELNQRTSNGEENLRIKYIKGVPKILNIPAKKSTP